MYLSFYDVSGDSVFSIVYFEIDWLNRANAQLYSERKRLTSRCLKRAFGPGERVSIVVTSRDTAVIYLMACSSLPALLLIGFVGFAPVARRNWWLL